MADRWQPVHYLSWEETQNAGWGFWTDEPGYDETKHEPNERGEVIFPREVRAEHGSGVETHWEYEPLTSAEAEQILANQRAAVAETEATWPGFDESLFLSPNRMTTSNTVLSNAGDSGPDPFEHLQMEVIDFQPAWEILRYLSYEESQHGYSSDPSDVAGYDPSKHDLSNPMPANEYTFPTPDPDDPEPGHFEYVPWVNYPTESDPTPPTIPIVNTETELDVVVDAGEGMTFLYWQPADWVSDGVADEWGMVDDSFVKVQDMHTAFFGRAHDIIGTMDNKIILETATDPANYQVEEWDPELGLAKYRLVLRRHNAMPVEYISRALADPIIEEVVISGVAFDGNGALMVDISDQGLILSDLNFTIPAGGYRVVACISGRQTAGETVALDMWPSDNPSAADEVLKIEGAWGRSRLYPPDPRSAYFNQ